MYGDSPKWFTLCYQHIALYLFQRTVLYIQQLLRSYWWTFVQLTGNAARDSRGRIT